MEFACCLGAFLLLALFLGDGLNIYLVVSLVLYCNWQIGTASPLLLIPASIFAIAGAIAGNGKRSGELEKRKLSFKK